MSAIENYFHKVLGQPVNIKELSREHVASLPMFLRELYSLKRIRILGHEAILMERISDRPLTVDQFHKHTKLVEFAFSRPTILVLKSIESYNKRRLIQRHISFVIPGKQMFIPQFLIDLKERGEGFLPDQEKLQPAAQCLLFFHLLRKDIQKYNFKQISTELGYTQMTITRAARDLASKHLANIEGKKERRLLFEIDRKKLWKASHPYLQNPVKKIYFQDDFVHSKLLYKASYSALAYYTDLSEDDREYFAVSQSDFSRLLALGKIEVSTDQDGPICIQVWKYPPALLTESQVVDPLSLYLSFDTRDERVETELEKLIENLW